MIIEKLIGLLSPKQLLRLGLLMLDNQTVSGYGASVTFKFPKERREEIINEIFKGEKTNDK